MFIKRIELTNFKSFGGTTAVPFVQGFTVISGPNGSGKSNLIDALLFCLGLAGSKGMRAERLPDLVNTTQSAKSRSTIEASVTVTFDLSDEPELLEDAIERQMNEEMGTGEAAADPESDAENGAENSENAAAAGDTENGNGDGNGKVPSEGDTRSQRFRGMVEWSVTRKLRVTQQGTYTSNYFINGEPCTLTELHEDLSRLRIHPEGYNVVLQGDVTRIISMNPRERREIIDELAGVATFDRKINQAKEKMDAVKEREDRYHIVEKELIEQRDRLAQDRLKAEKYQKLRAELHAKEQWEIVIRYRHSAKAVEQLQAQITRDEAKLVELAEQRAAIATTLIATAAELEQLNARVKALGEEEQLALQSTLATREAELRQFQRQEQELKTASQDLATQIARTQQEIADHRTTLATLATDQSERTRHAASQRRDRDAAKIAVEQLRDAASASADNAEAWVQEQTALHHQIDTILKSLEPQQKSQAQLSERVTLLDRQNQEQTASLTEIEQQLDEKRQQKAALTQTLADTIKTVQTLAATVANADNELKLQQETQTRLLSEQRDKQRRLDKLEAQTQAIREAQGTHATQLILNSDMPGICGMVAQLGRVDPRFQLALETAAGGRLGFLVVEDDAIAAAGIELLKQKRAGRATFLPLNKIQPGRTPGKGELRNLAGCVDFAFNLVDFEPRYREIFAFVFGTTVVFETLSAARRHMRDYRIVTLDGELLETSGAMTGGSSGSRSGIHFGTVDPAESVEVLELRDRLREIDKILNHCENSIAKASVVGKQRGDDLQQARQAHREAELKSEQLAKEIIQLETRLNQLLHQQEQTQQELTTAQARLQTLQTEVPAQEANLQSLRQTLADLEQSHTHSEWQQLQTNLRAQEAALQEKETALRSAEQLLQDSLNQQQRLQEKIHQGEARIQEQREQQTGQLQQQSALSAQMTTLNEQIAETKAALAALELRLGTEKQGRDRVERQLREQQTQQQQIEWEQQKIQETQTTRRQELVTLQEQLAAQGAELPDPMPDIPEDAPVDLAELQYQVRSLQKRITAMEPVNMMALEEYDRTQQRLQELTDKLTTLEEERTELLLRIENFTTLRQRAFKEAYDAVNENFQSIFATLSEGDGHLHLEDPNDPFNGGLNLVAHPKGKAVLRLASMSGGEKSLTALSFIFALQRYRPSPFYAFDEVDMFLDGANVERLSRMVKRQAELAQFIVVSLRRPMIEAAQRTIGVTQARGAYTQVLGIDLTGVPSN